MLGDGRGAGGWVGKGSDAMARRRLPPSCLMAANLARGYQPVGVQEAVPTGAGGYCGKAARKAKGVLSEERVFCFGSWGIAGARALPAWLAFPWLRDRSQGSPDQDWMR